MKQYRIDFNSMRWEKPADGVRFKAYGQDGKKLRLVEFAKEFVEPDWCTKGNLLINLRLIFNFIILVSYNNPVNLSQDHTLGT